MPDSNEAVPAPCLVIKEDINKCVREKGAESWIVTHKKIRPSKIFPSFPSSLIALD
ncbi:Hypothetical predicted protein [Xyrichtys novacula]|uniref:Uncharacterized protein n=1 Tax=Xyrichtys novacula TaxID=13765 RepID=A0AAV1H4M7_XYRNO|nr:Hypothetical predicted protein [Xyrichtys novacula]